MPSPQQNDSTPWDHRPKFSAGGADSDTGVIQVPKDKVAHRTLARQRLKILTEYEERRKAGEAVSFRELGKKYGYAKTRLNIWYRRWVNGNHRFETLLNHPPGPKQGKGKARLDVEAAVLKARNTHPDLRGPRLKRHLEKQGIMASGSVIWRAEKRLGLRPKVRKPPKAKKRISLDLPFGYIQVDTLRIDGLNGPIQYTAIESLTRLAFICVYPEMSVHNSVDFLTRLWRFYPFETLIFSTDGGSEFTSIPVTGKKSMFELALEHADKAHKIFINNPNRQGRVERLHRTCREEHWYKHVPLSVEYGIAKTADFLRWYNETREHQALGWQTPKGALEAHLKLKEPLSLRYDLVIAKGKTPKV